MKLQRHFAVSLLVSMALLLAVSPPAFAGPDLPAVNTLYGTATFTGNQSNGIRPESSWTCPPVYTFNVYGLITGITPAAGVAGVQIARLGANGGNGGGPFGATVARVTRVNSVADWCSYQHSHS